MTDAERINLANKNIETLVRMAVTREKELNDVYCVKDNDKQDLSSELGINSKYCEDGECAKCKSEYYENVANALISKYSV